MLRKTLFSIFQWIASQYQDQYQERSVSFPSDTMGFYIIIAPKSMKPSSGVQQKHIEMVTIFLVSGDFVDFAVR